MKAILISRNGTKIVMEMRNLPKPNPHADEVLIRIKAAGLNLIDIYMREKQQFGTSFIPGMEGSGIVEAVGENVKNIKCGDRVAYVGQLGSYAEFNLVKASKLILLPPDISFEIAVAALFQGMAAYHLIQKYYHVHPGDHVLIQAAAGGIGLLLVQWLKHLGAYVIAMVSSSEKGKIVLDSGADEVIYHSNFASLGDMDNVVGNINRNVLNNHEMADKDYFYLKTNSLVQSPYTSYQNGSSDVDSHPEYEILNGIKEGWLKIRINRIFPLEKAAEAQQLLEDRATIGKIIFRL